MDSVDKWKIVLGVFYVITALVLCGVAYTMLIKRFKRNKLSALNAISLITSRDNVFSAKTRFLIVAPEACHVKVELMDANEKPIVTLVDQELTEEELPFDFDPAHYESGKYYLYLSTDNAKILRSITIVK
ncbi:MAG: hypothetical protein HUJ25_05515 [Crocinitomicaceae bacterium]|nr:hypothetical protein [Crocinitomicaceae bacterium]